MLITRWQHCSDLVSIKLAQVSAARVTCGIVTHQAARVKHSVLTQSLPDAVEQLCVFKPAHHG